jgi:hypothetical protein
MERQQQPAIDSNRVIGPDRPEKPAEKLYLLPICYQNYQPRQVGFRGLRRGGPALFMNSELASIRVQRLAKRVKAIDDPRKSAALVMTCLTPCKMADVSAFLFATLSKLISQGGKLNSFGSTGPTRRVAASSELRDVGNTLWVL